MIGTVAAAIGALLLGAVAGLILGGIIFLIILLGVIRS
jgi:hypothetical protein